MKYLRQNSILLYAKSRNTAERTHAAAYVHTQTVQIDIFDTAYRKLGAHDIWCLINAF